MSLPKPLGWYAAVGAASIGLGVLLGWSAAGGQIDRWCYDFCLRLSEPASGPSRAVLLTIDEETLAQTGGIRRLREPLARALQIVSGYEPAAVAVDIVFSEPGEDGENQALEEAFAETPNLVLAVHLASFSGPGSGRWEEPIARFENTAAALGHTHADPDDDGICRRMLLAKAAGSTRRWALPLEVYRLVSGGGRIVETGEGLEVGGRFIPASYRDGRPLWIRYASRASPIERISLHEVLERPETASIARGRAVFVGVVVLAGLDRYLMTPYSYGEALPGVEINANVYETLARGKFFEVPPDSAVLVLAVLVALSLTASFVLLGGRRMLAVSAAVLAAAHLAVPALFSLGWVPAFSPVLAAGWLSFLGGGGCHYLGVRRGLRKAESDRDRYQRAIHYVTHEMRTPLTSIQGSSELISRYSLTEEKRKQVAETIHRESVRLGRMVEMFLGVERLSAGQLGLDRKPVLASDVLGVCLERCAPLAERKQIRMDCQSEGEPCIWGDREFLEYACYNLLTNGIKYSPAQSPIIVRAGRDGNWVRISVADHGYGMDASELKSIFRRFYRTERACDSGETGSGLGLALVEEIVIQHGGSIEADSRPGEGSCFTLLLPSHAPRHAPSPEPSPVPSPEPSPEPSHGETTDSLP